MTTTLYRRGRVRSPGLGVGWRRRPPSDPRVDPKQMAGFPDVDLVFCRNLLIYFDDVSRRKAVDLILEAMRPGAFICLGHSESMSRISPAFAVRKFADAIVYQKPL